MNLHVIRRLVYASMRPFADGTEPGRYIEVMTAYKTAQGYNCSTTTQLKKSLRETLSKSV